MIKAKTIVALGVLLHCAARAQIVYTFDTPTGIPDDGGLNGVNLTETIFGAPTSMTDVNVKLKLSSEWNGDLYISLTHSGQTAILLNRLGRSASRPDGYSDSGLNVTLDDSAGNGDIHIYRQTLGNENQFLNSALTGSWALDARNANPGSVVDTDPQSNSARLSVFNGLDGNGDWTLFMSDFSPGNLSSLQSWSLELSPVPEPVSGFIVGCSLLVGVGVAKLRQRTAGRRTSDWQHGP